MTICGSREHVGLLGEYATLTVNQTQKAARVRRLVEMTDETGTAMDF